MGLHPVSRLPLPQLTFDNAFFWTSGADGQLRIQECGDCKSLIHPPQPVCRYCKSHNMGIRAVSGRAVLSAFTVNHRFAMPGLAAPYVIAQVAIEEDPRVRLTTNIAASLLAKFPDGAARHLAGDCPDCGTTVFTAERPFEVVWVEAG